MSRLTTAGMLNLIEEMYFDKLEALCEDFTEYDDAGESLIKPEYLVSTKEMLEVIYQDNENSVWLIDWALMNLGGAR